MLEAAPTSRRYRTTAHCLSLATTHLVPAMRRRKSGVGRTDARPRWGYGLSAALALTLIAIGFSTISGGAGAATSAATSSTGAVVGDTTQESGSDQIPGGTAEAYAYTAATSGNIQTAHVYVRSGTTATSVAVGLYSDASGQPGTLLSMCAISSPAADAWQTCSANATVTAGARYWIALLPTGGSLSYATKGTEASQAESDRSLAAPPSAWTAGAGFTDGPASAYFDGSGGPSAPPPDTTPPSAPTGVTRTGATGTSISISWNASTDNLAVAGYGVYAAGAAAGGTGALAGSSTATTFTLTGLSCGTSYNVSVDAFDAAGNRSSKTTITTATSACVTTDPPTSNPNKKDRTPPSAPSGVHVQASTPNSVTLAWLASTDNVGVAGYNAYENGGKIGTTTALTYTFTGLACGTSYTFGAEAFDAAGNTSTRTTIVAATQACPVVDTTPPSPVSGLHVAGTTATSVTLAWIAATDNVGVAGYNMYKAGVKVDSTTNLTYTYTGLACGTTYTLAVQTFDAAGNTSNIAYATIKGTTSACAPPPPDTQPPTPPSNVHVTAATGSTITIAWNASTDNVGVIAYGIYNGTSTVTSTASLSYTVLGLTCGSTYTLSVDAADAAGNRSTKTPVTASTAACPPTDTQPPTAPTNVLVTGATQSSISLSWTAATDNVGVTSYRVYNGTATAGDTAALSFTVSGLSCGKTYTLAVDAADAAGNRSPKTSVNAATSACPLVPAATVYITPTGSDANPCTSTAPCTTFARAYAVASPGTTVSVAPGSYPAQSIPYSAAKAGATSRVVFQCAPASTSIIGSGTSGLGIAGAQHIQLSGCDLRGDFGVFAQNRSSPSSPEATDIAVIGGRMQSFHITGAQGVLIDGVDIGHYDYGQGFGSNSLYSDIGQPTERNVTIRNSIFQGITVPSGTHSECLFVKRVDGLTIQDNIMRGCPGLAIAMYDANAGSDSDSNTLANVLVENNFLSCGPVVDCYGGGQVAQMDWKSSETFRNVTWRFNSMVGSVYLNGAQTNGQWYGNAWVGGGISCGVSGVTLAYNVGISCGGTNKATAAQFVNPDRINGDFHILSASSPQVDFVPTSFCATVGCPATDIDGQSRPAGLAFDAGADELH